MKFTTLVCGLIGAAGMLAAHTAAAQQHVTDEIVPEVVPLVAVVEVVRARVHGRCRDVEREEGADTERNRP